MDFVLKFYNEQYDFSDFSNLRLRSLNNTQIFVYEQ